MKRLLAIAALTMMASSLALGQMTGNKENSSNQKGDRKTALLTSYNVS